MIVLFGSGATGSNLLYDMMSGAHERTLVAPLSRSSLLIGRACKELLPTAVQALIIVLVALPFGYHVTVSGFILGVILLAIFGVGLGALSYALALASKNHDWLFWGVQQTLIFPLLILSGLLIPLDYGPQWMRTAATVNPANWLVQALRILLDQGLTSDQAILYGVLSAVPSSEWASPSGLQQLTVNSYLSLSPFSKLSESFGGSKVAKNCSNASPSASPEGIASKSKAADSWDAS
jgi:ABC-2 type transporter